MKNQAAVAWTALRTLAAQASETGRPVAASFTTFLELANPFDTPGKVEFRFDAITVTGAPTSVTFNFYRLLDGRIDRVAQRVIATADLVDAEPFIVEANARQFYVVTTITAGTAPTVSGALQARPVS